MTDAFFLASQRTFFFLFFSTTATVISVVIKMGTFVVIAVLSSARFLLCSIIYSSIPRQLFAAFGLFRLLSL